MPSNMLLLLSLLSLLLLTSAFTTPHPTSTPSTHHPAGANQAGASQAERTYIMIKPDGVQRGLVGNIVTRFENRGFKLVAMKTKLASQSLLDTHYKDLVNKPFFPGLREYMMSGPVCCMVWEGTEAVKTGRMMLGATNPLESNPGTIRGDFCLEVSERGGGDGEEGEKRKREGGHWCLFV